MRLFDAIFFSIFFFILWMLYVSTELFHQMPMISLDFVINLTIFNMWLQTYGLMDGQTDGQNNGQRQNDGLKVQCMDGHSIYMHGPAKNNDFPTDFAIFTKALQTNRRTKGPTDRRTDGPTDGHTF